MEGTGSKRGNESIFIVDDNPENLNVLSEMLEAEGYQVRATLDGDSMIESAAEELPDLVILDIHLPGKDGYEICGELKASPATSDIPVIFCSALSESFNIVRVFEVGGVDYITKPFRKSEVLARIRTHIALRRQRRELEYALEYLRSAQAHLVESEKTRSLGTLVSGIAHEINNPINYVVNSTEALIEDFRRVDRVLSLFDGDTPTKQQLESVLTEVDYPVLRGEMGELLEGVHTGAMDIHRIVRSIRAFSTAPDAAEEQLDTAEEIQRALLIAAPGVPENVHLVHEIESLPAIVASPGHLSQALVHLLENALQAAKDASGSGEVGETGEVGVKARPADDRICEIIVWDTGPGIAAELRDRVFDPFFTTREAGHGMGLGLAISRKIIEDLGGTLSLESPAEGGTRVTVRIPAGDT